MIYTYVRMSITKTSSVVNAYNYNNRFISSLQLHRHNIIKRYYIVHNHSNFSVNRLFSKQTRGSSFLQTQSLQYLRNLDRQQTNNKSKRDFATYSSTDPQDMASFGSFMGSWKSWIVGALVTLILPFLTNKWGPLLKWTKEFEAAEEKVEELAETIEKVAVGVEKVAEDFVEKLPEGGKLKAAANFVENAAKEVIKDADFVEELIHKVDEVEKKVVTMMEDVETTSKEVDEVTKDIVKEVDEVAKDIAEVTKKKKVETMMENVNATSKEVDDVTKEVAEVTKEKKAETMMEDVEPTTKGVAELTNKGQKMKTMMEDVESKAKKVG